MASFREWLAACETIREAYEGSLWALAMEDAIYGLAEFYNEAVSGDLFLEQEEEDEDGPPELDDPFSGGEDAKPAWVAPEVPEPESKTPTRPSSNLAPTKAKTKIARAIQDAAWTIRWAAMIQRAELVERVKRIYEDEWLPLMRKREGRVREEYRIEAASGGTEDEVRGRVAEKLGLSAFEVAKSIGLSGVEWKVLEEEEEDDWGDIPDVHPEGPSIDENEKKIIDKVEPLLLKLGYVDSSEMKYGDVFERRNLAVKAMEAAAKETGNEPPDNKTTKRIRQSLSTAANAEKRLWDVMYEKYMGLARASYKKLSRKMGNDEETGEEIRGSQYFQDATEIFSDVVTKLIKSLSEREVNKDLTAPAWKSDLAFMTADPEKEPDAIIGSLGVRFRSQNVIRDVVRQDNKAAAQAPGSAQRAQRLSQGAMGDDGVQTSIDPEDTGTRDSLTTAATEESAVNLIDAFKQAMKEIKKESPTHSMLACLWFSLDCSKDGTPAETKVTELMSAAGGATMSSRITPKQFLDRLGRQGLVSGQGRGVSAAAGWKLVELIVEKDLPRDGRTLSLRPMGKIPDDRPNYQTVRNNPGSITPEKKKWWDFYNTVNDAKNKAIYFIMKRMNEIMVEQSDDLSAGQKDAHSWSLPKFLETSYMDQVRTGHAIVNSRSDNDATIKFYSSDKRAATRSFRLTADRDKVTVVQDYPPGFEGNVFRFTMPATPPGHPMDSRGLMGMEWKIRERLGKTQRKKG